MSNSRYVWLDGKYIPFAKATVHVQTHALHYGSSVFEGLRAYPAPGGPRLLFLNAHIKRLYASARMVRMDIPFTQAEMRDAIKQLVRKNKHVACYVRPICFRGDEALGVNPRHCSVRCAIMTLDWSTYLGNDALEHGVDVGVSSWRRHVPGVGMPLGKIGGQYVNSQMIVMEAQDHGYVEGIALDVHGFISEASAANLFVVHDGVIYTAPLAASILMGITRTGIIQIAQHLGYEVREMSLPREFLYLADEIFLTGTAAEVTPVRSVDKLKVGNGKRGSITQQIQKMFFDIVYNRVEDRWKWMS